MRKIAILGLALAMAGCAAKEPFRPDAVPAAAATLSAQNEQCVARLSARQFANMAGFTECVAIAKVAFTKSIGLRDDTLLKAWIARMATAAGEFDAGRLDAPGYAARVGQINSDFNGALIQEYRINAAQRAEAAARMQAFSAALLNASAAMQASQPPAAPMMQGPINCQSYKLGFTTQTHCN